MPLGRGGPNLGDEPIRGLTEIPSRPQPPALTNRRGSGRFVRRHFASRLTGGHVLSQLACGAALSASIAYSPSIAHAQQGCEIEKAQALFGDRPRQAAEVERLLAACRASGSTDYRVSMFLGIMARDAGDREQAISHLRKAHEIAPQELNPAFELGYT